MSKFICHNCENFTSREQVFLLQGSIKEIRDLPCWGCKYLFRDEDNYSSKLLTCPFCGSQAHISTDDGGDSGIETYTVICDGCSCDIGWFDTKKEAIDRWNTRVT